MPASRIPLLIVAAALALAWATPASAQAAGPQRNCQTVLTCNFAKGGSYRGCLSSYSCRQCGFVAVRCRGGRGRVCREMRCDWGAGV
jgi:hypothetical protein